MSQTTRFLLIVVLLGVLAVLLTHMGSIFAATGPSLNVFIQQPSPTATALPVNHERRPVVRLGQLDPAQYLSTNQFETWAYSACSAAAMAALINAYSATGHSYRVGDILQVEASFRNPTVITPEQGLLYPHGLDRTLATFHFKTIWLNQPNIATIVRLANTGQPVLVNFPPALYPGGHFVVVTGGTGNQIDTADSSLYNHKVFSYATFSQIWNGFALRIEPI